MIPAAMSIGIHFNKIITATITIKTIIGSITIPPV